MRNAVERAVIMAKGDQLFPEDFPADTRCKNAASLAKGEDLQIGSLISLEKLEEAHVRKVIERASSLAEAADILGIDQATLWRKRKKIGIER